MQVRCSDHFWLVSCGSPLIGRTGQVTASTSLILLLICSSSSSISLQVQKLIHLCKELYFHIMIAKKLFRKKVAVSPRAFTLEPRTFAPLCILASRPQVKKYSPSERLKIKPHVKQFSTSTALNDGIIPVMGDNSKSVDKADQSLLQAAQISTEDYEEIANKTMDDLSSTLEEVQEQKGNLDTEYSVYRHAIIFSYETN